MTLAERIKNSTTTAAALASWLDDLPHAERLAQTLALGSDEQARLFELAAGARRFTLDDLAPQSTPPLTGVRHEGKNSMLLFTRFAKIFAMPDEPTAQPERWGYNEGSQLVKTAVGPGYFVAVQQGDEVLVDYTLVPKKPLLGAPRILPNDARLSRFVFNQTKDVVRGVSKHVSIGRAWRGKRQLDNWFVLCRAS
jgi:hypothetical protein